MDLYRVLLKPWCEQHALPLPSVSTIGRIIQAAPDKMRLCPTRVDSRGRPKPPRARKPRRPKGVTTAPMELFACDTVERIQNGIRRYVFTFTLCNRKLAAWLVFYNTKRPQQALALQAPASSLFTSRPECQMLWTYTQDAPLPDPSGFPRTTQTPPSAQTAPPQRCHHRTHGTIRL